MGRGSTLLLSLVVGSTRALTLMLLQTLLLCTTGDSRLLLTLTPLFATPFPAFASAILPFPVNPEAPLPVRVSMTTIGGGTAESASSEDEFVRVVDAIE